MLVFTLFCGLFAWSGAGAGRATEIDFAHDIVPVLRKHCGACHLGEKKQGGFSMNTRELLLAGGEYGEAVQPGQSAQSALIRRVLSEDSDLRMPPEGARVSPEEVATLKQWIDAGVAWEAGFTFAGLAFEPPLRPRRVTLPPSVAGRENPVDQLVDDYLAEHKLPRQPLIDDTVFCRRVHLDVIGLLPEPDELARFLADPSPDKRQRLVHDLLQRDIDYAEHWLTFWNDLLRNDYTGTGFITQGRKQITNWLYDALVQNKPYDLFVRELIAPTPESEGFIQGIRWRGNVNASQTQEIQFAQNISQAFLGINLKCASCHDSFIDRWTLQETYNLAAVYATEPLTLHRCDKPLGQLAQAAWIFPELGQVDATAAQPERLRQLATLMTHPENGRFTRTIVNRLWHRLLGRGIVHPVDAMHTEPWNADLLDYLATQLADQGYDLKATIELICTSQTYQSELPPLPPADAGPYIFRGPLARRLTAEQFLDAVWQVTGAAPLQYDAAVVRAKLDPAASHPTAPLQAHWIWSRADASRTATAGETITLRRQFDLAEMPVSAVAVVTCDNSYRMFVNDREVAADDNWETVELVSLQPHLKIGTNAILLISANAGNEPNPAGLIFEARLRTPSDVRTLASDSSWQWTTSQPDRRGRFQQPPDDWQPAALVQNQRVWSARVTPQLLNLLSSAEQSSLRMVRASLVKNDFLMRSLGRPNRDQIVTMRPSELTTLEAIDLANGQALAAVIEQGARRRWSEHHDAGSLVNWLYAAALSRLPTAEEAALAEELLAASAPEAAVEDLLWSLFMLPEFQLIR